MPRAMTAGEITDLESDGQYSLLYLGTLIPNTVGTCQVAAAPASDDEVASISVKNWAWGSGYSIADSDLLVYIGTSAGAYDVGMVRLRSNATGTPSTLLIGETSSVAWAVDQYITVVDEIPIAPRHLRIDSNLVVYMDYDTAYSDQHDALDPVPAMGPCYVPVWLAAGGTVDVEFDGSESWTQDGTITGYQWTAQGASATSGMTTATPTITYNATGTYRVQLHVTGSNGKLQAGLRYVRVFGPSDMPITKFRMESCTGNWSSGGWSARVILHDEATTTEIRDRAMMCIFTRDFFGGDEVLHGPWADRENILMIGWVEGESIEWDPEEGTVSFNIQGPHFWLQQLQGFPSGYESVSGTPTTWTELQNMTTKLGSWAFFRWRTTIPRMLDVFVIDDDREVKLFDAAPGTLWQQINNEVWGMIFSRTASDRFGIIWQGIEHNLIPVGDRGFIPNVLNVLPQHLRRPVNIVRSVVNKTGLVDLSGVYYEAASDTYETYFSLAPGHIPLAPGQTIERAERLALASQDQSNTLAGLLLGSKNNPYPSVTLNFAGNMRFLDIFPHQTVTLPISADDTKRGISGTLTLIPRTVSFKHDPATGHLTTSVTAEGETDDTGVPNIIGDPPPEPPPPGEPPVPPPPWEPIPIPELDGKYVVVGGGGKMLYTADVDDATPVYVEIGATPLSETIIDFCFDPDNNSQLAVLTNPGTGSTVGNIYVIDDYTDGAATWTLINDGATTYSSIVSTYGGCDGVGSRIRAATGGKLVIGVGASNRWLGVYGSFSSCNNVGTLTTGPNNRTGLRSMASVGGVFYAAGTSDFSIWVDFTYWSSSDGNFWTIVSNQGVGGFGMYHGVYCYGLLPTEDGDILISNWRAASGFPDVTFGRFGGGSPAALTEIDTWVDNSAPVANTEEILEGGPGSSDAFFATSSAAPSSYGTTIIYKNTSYPVAWNSVSITSLCETMDNFRGAYTTIVPEDRIVLGKTQSYGTDRVVWLLEDGGATLGNKTGNLYSTHGVQSVAKVLFDQNR